MNSKKNLIIVGIVIVVLIAGGFLWKGGFLGRSGGTAQPGVEGQTGEQATGGQTAEEARKVIDEMTKGGTIGKMTDEIFIEISARIYYIQSLNKTEAEKNILVEKLLSKYGVTFVNFSLYSDTITKDPNTSRFLEIMKKVSQRESELQKTGGI